MGKSFFLFIAVVVIAAILFFPIYLEMDAHYDMNRKKFAFAIYLYKLVPLIGGYATTYPGGIALHISKKKAILLPYRQLDSERKKFSLFKTFHLKSFQLTTESGAEYLFMVATMHAVLRTLFFIKGGEKEYIENNLWLTDGDELRLSLNCLLYFNLYILLKSFVKFCKEKIRKLCREKMRKSAL